MTYEEAIKDLEQLKQSFYDLDINKSLCLSLNAAIEALGKQNSCKDCAGCTQWLCDCSNVKAETVDRIVEQLEDKAKSYQEYYPEDYIFEVSDMIDLCESIIRMIKGEEDAR